MTSPDPSLAPDPSPAPPWWKGPLTWLLGIAAAVGAFVVGVLAFSNRRPIPLIFVPVRPDLDDVKVPPVDTNPSDDYEATKVAPADAAKRAEVDAIVTRLNLQDLQDTEPK